MITTTSALGRSSIYNWLKFENRWVFESIGFTEGFGHFHFSDGLFQDLVSYLTEQHGDIRGHQYTDGPNWRIRLNWAARQSNAWRTPRPYLGDAIRRAMNR